MGQCIQLECLFRKLWRITGVYSYLALTSQWPSFPADAGSLLAYRRSRQTSTGSLQLQVLEMIDLLEVRLPSRCSISSLTR
jgi:hypothetical protein